MRETEPLTWTEPEGLGWTEMDPMREMEPMIGAPTAEELRLRREREERRRKARKDAAIDDYLRSIGSERWIASRSISATRTCGLDAAGHKVEAIAAAFNMGAKAVRTIVNGDPATADEVEQAAEARRLLERSRDPLHVLQWQIYGDADESWFAVAPAPGGSG